MQTSSNKHLKPILYHENLITIVTQTLGRYYLLFSFLAEANFCLSILFVWIRVYLSSFHTISLAGNTLSPPVCQKLIVELSKSFAFLF